MDPRPENKCAIALEDRPLDKPTRDNAPRARRAAAGSPVDHARIEAAIREILEAVGEDPDREGLRETPARVARMYAELFAGLHEDPRAHLRRVFTVKYDEMVLVKDITFAGP